MTEEDNATFNTSMSGQPETYIAAANERNAGRIDEDLAGDQPPFRPAGPREVQPETIDSMRSNMYDNLPLPAGPAVPVTPVERQVLSPGSVMSAYEASLEPPAVPEDVRRDVVTEQLSPIDNPSIASSNTLTTTDKEIEQPALKNVSQLTTSLSGGSSSNAILEAKTFVENYVIDNINRGFMTVTEGNSLLDAQNSKELRKVVDSYIVRAKERSDSRVRENNRLSEEKEKAKRAGVN